HRLWTPGGEARCDPLRHEEVQPLGGRADRILNLGVAVGFRHLDSADEVGDDMRRAEDLGGVHDAAYPLIAPDVAGLAGADLREEVRIPDLVVRMVDLRARRLEPLDILNGPRLRHDLADPAAREFVLNGLDILRV